MAENTQGWRAVLSQPGVYILLKKILGVTRAREAFLREHVRPFPGMRLLDLGCGPADILDDLPENVHYVGCDFQDDYLAAARARYGDRGVFLRIDLARGEQAARLEDMPPFDQVALIGILHHLEGEEARSLLAFARRFLKKGGRLVCSDPVLTEPQHPVARWFALRDRGKNVRYTEAHMRLFEASWPGAVPVIRTDLLRVPYTNITVCAEKCE